MWAFQAGSVGEGILKFLIAGLTLLCGVLMVVNPVFASGFFTILLSLYFIIDGISEIAVGVGDRQSEELAIGQHAAVGGGDAQQPLAIRQGDAFLEVAPRFLTRPGGYTRILKTGNRRGDNAEMAIIRFVDVVPGVRVASSCTSHSSSA